MQNLAMAIKDLHAEVRESAVTKKEELESLPLECTRMDLFSYISTTPIQYSIIFPSQKIRQSWEQEFLQAKRTADNEAPPYASVAPPTSPFPAEVSRCTEIEFRNSAIVQSGKIGTVVSVATLYPVSPTLHPVSPILHPVSPILHPVSPILHPVSPTLYPVSPTLHPVSPTLHPVSPTLHSVSPTLHPVNPTLHPVNPTLHPVNPHHTQSVPPYTQSVPTLHPVNPTLHPVNPTLHHITPSQSHFTSSCALQTNTGF